MPFFAVGGGQGQRPIVGFGHVRGTAVGRLMTLF